MPAKWWYDALSWRARLYDAYTLQIVRKVAAVDWRFRGILTHEILLSLLPIKKMYIKHIT